MSIEIRRLDTLQADFEARFNDLLAWDQREDPAIVAAAKRIIQAVQTEGDEALLRFTRTFDHRSITSASEFTIESEVMAAAWNRLPQSERDTLQLAADRIRTYHEQLLPQDSDYLDAFGNRLSTRTTPIDRVGVYVPSGQASYPSTVLMTLIPATIAGVSETIVVVPMPSDILSDHVLAALHLAKPTRAFGIGGAQAIAALAYGTATIPKVDKIVGPGGDWVAAAKKLVFGPVGIEAIAGPSEILIIADGTVEPAWTAWDVMSQAEHDASAQAILVCPSAEYIEAVCRELEAKLRISSRASIIRQSLTQRSAFIRSQSLTEAIHIANRIAPEHLQLAIENPRSRLHEVKHAGAIFLGRYSAEAIGDYVAGSSHVLPTFGTARYASVLGVQDFMKRTSIIDITASGADVLGRAAGAFAELEGLSAHAHAARIRVHDYDSNR